MTPIFYDFETRSPTPIRYGVDNYFLPAQPLLLTYAVGDGPVQLVDYTQPDTWRTDMLTPAQAFQHQFSMWSQSPDAVLVAHNNQFDRRVLERLFGCRIPIERFRCTQAQASAHGLPGSLETLGQVLGTKHRKRTGDAGHKLMLFFCTPRAILKDGTPVWNEPADHPQKWEDFKGYAIDDTETLRDVYRKLPTHNFQGLNLEAWFLDQKINERGFGFDRQLAGAASRLLDAAKVDQKRYVSALTLGEVASVTQREKLLEWFNNSGLEIASLKASEIREALEGDDLPPAHRFLLELRLEGSKSSGAKYRRGLECVGPDGRIRDTMLYAGANRTGRWSGRNFQPQNLPRPSGRWETIDKDNPWKPIEEIAVPAVLYDDAAAVVEHGGANSICNDIIRSCIVAELGNEFVSADWANIESRFLAWCTDNHWKLDYFRAVDRGEAADSYKALWARFFGMKADDVSKKERQAAKQLDLACIAEGTLVLTDSGYVAIQDVTRYHRVWDGAAWVSHQGLLFKGVMPTVVLDGVHATADHLFKCHPRRWVQAQTLSSSKNILARALAIGSANLPSSVDAKATTRSAGFCPSHALAALGRMMFRGVTSGPGVRLDATDAPNALQRWRASVLPTPSGPARSRTLPYAADCTIACPQLSGAATIREIAITPTTGGAGYTSTPNGAQIKELSCGTARRWKDSVMRAWKWIVSTTTKATSRGTFASSPSASTPPTAEPSAACSAESKSWKRVYDIVNAGPRNCFTVKSRSGHLIAHNCGYLGGTGALVTMAIGNNVNLEELMVGVLERVPEEIRRKAHRNWRRAFLNGEDFGLEPWVYQSCDALVRLYRQANDAVVDEGYHIGKVVSQAMSQPNTLFRAAKCDLWYNGNALILQLPSGRRLYYWSPQMRSEREEDPETGEVKIREVFWYKASRGKQWRWLKGWPGLWIENICQAGCLDVLRAGMLNVQQYCEREPRIAAWLATLPTNARTPLVLHVHDEPTCELPRGLLSHEKLEWLLTEDLAAKHPWMKGLPLAASGWTGNHYRK